MENEAIEIKPKNMYAPICITQLVCIAVIVLSVLIIKFFFKEHFLKLQNWYKENVLYHTTAAAFDEENL